MIIYVKYATHTFPSNFVLERTNEPMDNFEPLEIESLESFLSEQNQILMDFMAIASAPPEVEEEVSEN